MSSPINRPHVTVVIPCHNREDTVSEAVFSVLEQDYPSFDVVAVDDSSTDRTVEILQGIDDPRLSIAFNSGPRGPSATRNHGAAQSSAPWIAFQDSDDIWLPGKLRKQMERVAESDYVAVYCGMIIKEDGRPATPVQDRIPGPEITTLDGDILPSLVKNSFISTQMVAIRRDVFDTVGGFDEALPALVDWELMLRVAQQGPVAFVDEDLVVQRMSPNSITRSSKKRLGAQEYVLNKHETLLSAYPEALGHHHHRIAGAHRMFGNISEAAKNAKAAWRAQPMNMKYLANVAYLSLKGLAS